MAAISAEIRWFWPATDQALTGEIERWLTGGAVEIAAGETRVDTYVVNAQEKELGVKTRGTGSALEIKGLLGHSAPLDVGPLSGPVQLWAKWRTVSLAFGESAQHTRVAKQRWLRRFDASVTPIAERAVPGGSDPSGGPPPPLGCHVERTRLEVEGVTGAWWTMGFEAFGAWSEVAGVLRATAELLAPGAPDLERALRFSYPEWLAHLSAP